MRSPAFWILFVGIFLCSVPMALHNLQMKMMLLDNGASSTVAAAILSSYATGVLVGRLLCGVALDRWPAHIVAAISMGLPSIGLLLIASPLDTTPALAVGVALMGLSLGAEGDVMAYLVMRYFGVQVYSSVLGLIVAAVGIASAIGSILLSATLGATGHFTVFVSGGGVAVLLGAALFLLLRRAPAAPAPADAADLNDAVPLRQANAR